MNEEQLAGLLAKHLDALLDDQPLPETAPDEVVELLAVAHSLTETAPAPRPEFGPALKESLLGPTLGGNGAAPSTGSFGGGQMGPVIVVGLLAGLAILAVLVSVVLGVLPSNSGATAPTPLPRPPQTASATSTPALTRPATSVVPVTSTLTPTSIIDRLPAITVTVDIVIEPPALRPGSGGGSDGGSNDGDHDRGHGNDPDRHDEDNPGKGRSKDDD